MESGTMHVVHITEGTRTTTGPDETLVKGATIKCLIRETCTGREWQLREVISRKKPPGLAPASWARAVVLGRHESRERDLLIGLSC